MVTLKDDRVRAMLIRFLVLHDADVRETYRSSHHEAWYVIELADKDNLDIKLLQPWFHSWHENAPLDTIKSEEICYPCWVFNHAKGFQRATKYLVYNAKSYVVEWKPYTDFHLRLRPLIVRK